MPNDQRPGGIDRQLGQLGKNLVLGLERLDCWQLLSGNNNSEPCFGDCRARRRPVLCRDKPPAFVGLGNTIIVLRMPLDLRAHGPGRMEHLLQQAVFQDERGGLLSQPWSRV